MEEKSNKTILRGRTPLLIAIVLTAMAIVAIMIYAVNYFNSLDDRTNAGNNIKRIAFICSNAGMEGRNDILTGLLESAENEDMAVENFTTEQNHLSVPEMIRCAAESGIDGIIVYSDDDATPEITNAINYAVNKNIPVITTINDYPVSNRDCFIGVSDDRFPQLVDTIKGFDTERNEVLQVESTTKNLKRTYAFQKSVGESTGINIKGSYRENSEIFDSDAFFKTLNNTYPNVNVICCLDAFSTVGVAQTLIDRNRTDILVTGFGQSDEILKLIQNRVVNATISVDYESVGQSAIMAMEKAFGGKLSYETEYVEASIITRNNLDEYLKNHNDEQ